MKNVFVVIVLFLSSLTADVFAQNEGVNIHEVPYIEVTGKAEKEVIPDEIYISITIRERQEGRVKITIETQDQDLKDGLKSIGVSLENLSLSDAQADYVKVKWKTNEVISKKEYVLKVSDAETVGLVFEKLDALKILDARISRVSHSDLIELKQEIRILAIKAAKNKADYLLSAVGQKTGRALIVLEKSASYDDGSFANVRGARSDANYYYIDGMKVNGSASLPKKVVVQFEKIKLSASIYVKFEIE